MAHLDNANLLKQLTHAASQGDLRAKEELIRQLYPQLRLIARRQLAMNATPTHLDTTGLLHDSLAKLLEQGFATIENERHLVAYVATTMRHILIDYARERKSQKRDAGERVTLTNLDVVTPDRNYDLVALDQALTRLEQLDARLGQLIEMRCFGGLSVKEIAEELGVSERTIKRDWQKAQAFLITFLEHSPTQE
jgi:RNA polymerase sigma factor (TIGR02999 family)